MSRPRSPVAIAALLACFVNLASAVPYKLDPGPHKVQTIDQELNDPARNRVVPVRIYLADGLASPQPVVLLSHGLGGSRAAMNYVAEHWASYGYVCVTLQHPGSDEGVWRDAPPGQRLSEIRRAANARQALARCGDVSFAIDHVAELNKTGGLFAGKVDLQHIGIAGHSFGAQTVQAVLGQHPPARLAAMAKLDRADPRVQAGIAFSPAFHGVGAPADAFTGFTRPCFHFTGTKDDSHLATDVPPEQRRVPYDAIDADRQYLMTFADGTHAVFGGIRPGRAESDLDKRIHDGVRQASTAFWDATLRQDADAQAWLDGEGAAGVLGKLGRYEHKNRSDHADAATRPAAAR